MKKILLYFFLFQFISLCAQVQIGQDIDGEAAFDESGTSVSISSNGSRIIVGAPENDGNGTDSGHVRVYELNSTTNSWTKIGQDIDGEVSRDEFGTSVAISGDGSIIAVGAPFNGGGNGNSNLQDSGHVRLYDYNGSEWIQIGSDIIYRADGDSIQSESGTSISLSSNGNIVAIGAPLYNNNNNLDSGQVRVFENQSGAWVQIGEDINGGRAGDKSGTHISLSADGTTLAVGAPNHLNQLVGVVGKVRVFKFDGSLWNSIGQSIVGANNDRNLGSQVSISSDGSVLATSSNSFVRLYENISDVWTPIGSDISGFNSKISLSSDGNLIGIGTNFTNGSITSGVVKIYENQSNNWNQLGSDILDEFDNDQIGRAIALSSDKKTLIAGTPRNDENGTNSGHVRVFDLSNITLSTITVDQINVNLYPNPSEGFFNVQFNGSQENVTLKVYNSIGALITEEKNINQQNYLLNIKNNPAGIYFLSIEGEDLGVKKLKLIKR